MSKDSGYTLEDAISQTQFGKFNYVLIVISGLLLACGFLEASCISMVLPIAQCDLDLSSFDKGLLGSISYIGIILSSHFWGFLADTKGRKKIIVTALFMSFLFTVMSTFAKSFWLLVLFRFLNGFCICAPQTITYAYLGEFHSLKNRSRVILAASVLYALFCLINPLNGIVFLNRESWNLYIPILDLNYGAWRIFLLMCGVPSVISAIATILFIPESPKFSYAQGDEAGTLKILQKIFKLNTGKLVDEYEVKSLIKDQEFLEAGVHCSKSFFDFMWSQTIPLFKHPHLKNTLTACYLQFGICVATNGFYTFFPEILNKISIWLDNNKSSSNSYTVCEVLDFYDKNANISSLLENDASTCVTTLKLNTFANVAMLMILFGIFWFITSVIVNKTGKLVIILTIMFSGGISSILLIFVKMPSLSIYLYFVLLMASVNMSVINASTVELFPTKLRAMAVSISMMTGRIGSVTGSNFVGLLINDYCAYIWILPAVLSITSGFLSCTIPNINKRIK